MSTKLFRPAAPRIRHFLIRTYRPAAFRQDGQVLALFAAGLVGLCGLVGLSIDVGRLAYTASDVQKIADSAALAGAQDLPNTTSATSTANSYAAQNGSATVAIAFTNSDQTIEVKASRQVDYTFLKVIGLSGKTVSRSAAVSAKTEVVTGFTLANTAPFIIWGGARQSEVNPGDQNCDFHTCVGKSYTFLDSNWMNASGKPKLPDWNSADSNNFKGDIAHGDGAAINHVGDTMSVGGLGSVEVPAVGTKLVIPVVDKAGGNSNMRTFHIAAWVQVEVQPGCTKNGCKGKVMPLTTTPPTGWVGGGTVAPPPTLTYNGTTITMTK
jgi:Flp pilus assembly protein TadG